MNPLTDHIAATLANSAIIKIEGADAQTFLHNQFTNDLRAVNERTSQLSSYCSPKGRILALFRIFKQGDSYFMVMPAATAAPAIKRLRMFVLMSKVTITDLSGEMAHLGFSGAESAERLQRLLGEMPDSVDGVRHHDGITVIRTPGPLPRFDLFGPRERIAALQQQLAAAAASAGDDEWELLDIHAAIPAIHPQNIEAFVPQMVNLQAINGLSFKKGCYPGQEIVARMQYLGKLKRRMYLAHTECGTPPAPATAIIAPASGEGEEHKAGSVVMAQRNPLGGCDLLAVLEIEAAETGGLHLEAASGPVLSLLPLPYPLAT